MVWPGGGWARLTVPPLVTEGIAAPGSELLLALVKSVENCKEARRGPVNRGNIHSPSVAEEC